ncbi:MAG: nucleotidyltransferase family protein [Frankiaceae bacterium]
MRSVGEAAPVADGDGIIRQRPDHGAANGQITVRAGLAARAGRRRATTLTGRVLVASAAADRAAAAREVQRLLAGRSPRDVPRLAVAARWHRVGGLLLDALGGDGPADVVGVLEEDYVASVRRELAVLADLRRAAAVLDGLAGLAGIDGIADRWLVLKGPVLAERYYGAAGLRAYTDVDILVPAAGFAAAVDALTAAGCTEVDRNWGFLAAHRAGEVALRGWCGTPVDLHWALLFGGALRDQFAVDVAGAVRRARPVTAAGLSLLTFDAVDTLVHLCLHAAMEGGHRLVWLTDLDRCIRVDAPPWDEVVERAVEWRVAVPVGLLLARARHVLGAPVPAWVVRRLLGRPAGAVAAAVDRIWPAERASDRGSPARMLARSARSTSAATAAELASRVRELRPRNAYELLRPASKRPRSSPLYEQSGDGVTREAFLSSVAGPAGGGR